MDGLAQPWLEVNGTRNTKSTHSIAQFVRRSSSTCGVCERGLPVLENPGSEIASQCPRHELFPRSNSFIVRKVSARYPSAITQCITMVDSETSSKSRQQSCNACARRKRHCDRRTPKCAPCAKQGLSCLYHKFPAGSGSDNSGHAMDIDLEGLAQFFTAADQSFSSVFSTDFEVDDP